jgi:hypothetical protein
MSIKIRITYKESFVIYYVVKSSCHGWRIKHHIFVHKYLPIPGLSKPSENLLVSQTPADKLSMSPEILSVKENLKWTRWHVDGEMGKTKAAQRSGVRKRKVCNKDDSCPYYIHTTQLRQVNSLTKRKHAPQRQKWEIDGLFMSISCVRAHCLAWRAEWAWVLPFPLLNSFYQVETSQLFKLASLYRE